MFEDTVFWTDRVAGQVSQCNKYNCSSREVTISRVNRPLGVAIVHPVRQPPGRFFFWPLRSKAIGALSFTMCVHTSVHLHSLYLKTISAHKFDVFVMFMMLQCKYTRPVSLLGIFSVFMIKCIMCDTRHNT